MQMLSAANNQDTNREPVRETNWVHEDPPNINFRILVPGMSCPAGWAKEINVSTDRRSALPDGREFEWAAFAIPELRISQPVHIMFIEGGSPGWVFLGVKLQRLGTEELLPGPYILLKLDAPAIHTTPYILKNVVLGRPSAVPDGAKLVDLLPVMVRVVLTESKQ